MGQILTRCVRRQPRIRDLPPFHATALEALLNPITEPILSPIWVAIAFGEHPGPSALASGVIVVGAVARRAMLGHRPARAG